MNQNTKRKIVGLSVAAFVVIAFFIINGLNSKNKEADVLSVNKEEIINKSTEASASDTASNEEIAGTPFALEASDKANETEKKITISKETKENINTLIKEYYGNTKNLDGEVIASAKKQDADKAVESITEKREGIEKYDNVKTIIRSGLDERTYLVFTTYNMKFYNIETEAPGMSVVYVITDKSGILAIDQDTNDQKLQNYINELSQEDEIKSEIERINTELESATKKDETLKDFINKLQKASK